jgi:hypothetical protein
MDIDSQVGDNLGTMPAGCKSLCSVPNVLSAQTYSVDLRDQCVCNDPLICQCPSTSASMLSDVPMLSDVSMLFALPITSMNIIRDTFFGHYVAHSRISVFNPVSLCTGSPHCDWGLCWPSTVGMAKLPFNLFQHYLSIVTTHLRRHPRRGAGTRLPMLHSKISERSPRPRPPVRPKEGATAAVQAINWLKFLLSCFVF